LEFQKRFTPLLEILNNSEEWNQGGDLLHGKAIWIQCKQGEKRVIAVTVLEEDGEPLDRFFWIVGLDITRQHEEDEERRELEARLRYAQKWDDLGILSGGLAHNFNNLLMCIMGNTELARLGLPPDSSVQINLNQIERASKQAAVLCQKMQSYTGKCHLVMVPKDLRQFTEEMVSLITERIPESIEFRAEYHLIPGQFIPVQMDVGRFREGMMGLLENAIEAIGPSPGGIRLCVGVEPCDPQDLSSRWILPDFEPGLFGYFEWIDTGCGMDEETRFSIFDPFYTTKFLGRGLGLPSVLGIVRRHGGTLCVHSEPARGTSVKVFLPVVKEESGLEPQT
jgi:signal transduction histidine kinase